MKKSLANLDQPQAAMRIDGVRAVDLFEAVVVSILSSEDLWGMRQSPSVMTKRDLENTVA